MATLSKSTDGYIQPKYRYHLRAQIHASGYRTLSEFATKVGVNISHISRVCAGLEYPSRKLCHAIAQEIGLSMRELGALL